MAAHIDQIVTPEYSSEVILLASAWVLYFAEPKLVHWCVEQLGSGRLVELPSDDLTRIRHSATDIFETCGREESDHDLLYDQSTTEIEAITAIVTADLKKKTQVATEYAIRWIHVVLALAALGAVIARTLSVSVLLLLGVLTGTVVILLAYLLISFGWSNAKKLRSASITAAILASALFIVSVGVHLKAASHGASDAATADKGSKSDADDKSTSPSTQPKGGSKASE